MSLRSIARIAMREDDGPSGAVFGIRRRLRSAVAIALSMIDCDNPQRRFLQALILSDGTTQRALLFMPRVAL